MQRLRTYGLIRLLAIVTAFSTAMLTVAPALGYRAVHVSYGDWLRSQMGGPLETVVEDSLVELEAERFRSVEAFLIALVERLEADGADAGAYFGVAGLGGGYLVSYLESRFSHLTPDALPARALLTIAPSTTVSSDRHGGAAVAGSFEHPPSMMLLGRLDVAIDGASPSPEIHFSLRPRAP